MIQRMSRVTPPPAWHVICGKIVRRHIICFILNFLPMSKLRDELGRYNADSILVEDKSGFRNSINAKVLKIWRMFLPFMLSFCWKDKGFGNFTCGVHLSYSHSLGSPLFLFLLYISWWCLIIFPLCTVEVFFNRTCFLYK